MPISLRVLAMRDLDLRSTRAAYDKILPLLRRGEFRAAQVKKLANHDLYRAKLSDADRLLFRFGKIAGDVVLLVLEVIHQHAYDKARFLRGVDWNEDDLVEVPDVKDAEQLRPAATSLRFVHAAAAELHYLDKPISFDDAQRQVFDTPLPLIVVGSAGSGKTALTLEKLKTLPGHGLFLSRSRFLVDNARMLHHAHGYENDAQEVEFLSLDDLLRTVAVPEGRAATWYDFIRWYERGRGPLPRKDAHRVFEEFKGVLTGASLDQPSLTLEQYTSLGVKQSIFLGDDRPRVHAALGRWLDHCAQGGLYDPGIAAFDRIARAEPTFDFLVIDEVQDLTLVELRLALAVLADPSAFMLCGDANQIVHPNLFSWSRVKSLFYERITPNSEGGRSALDQIHVLAANYRNTHAVTAIANRLLEIKQLRFGSVDRESNHLVEAVGDAPGHVELLSDTDAVRSEVDKRIRRSAKAAVIVLREEDKEPARQTFSTPLVFSVQEAKGLEYETVVLWNVIGAANTEFRECCAGVDPSQLTGVLHYARASDKTDKSLDAYKFFVNALYVALTRAIESVVLLESDPKHPLFRLLSVEHLGDEVSLRGVESSAEEWQREARRLELQGKSEQAERIRREVLEQEPVPWQIFDGKELPILVDRALTGPRTDKAMQQRLLEVALTYSLDGLVRALADAGFKHARKPESAREFIARTHYVDYQFRSSGRLQDQLRRYGIDHRNPLGQTPLMIAAVLGRGELVGKLLEDGADVEALDPGGCDAIRLVLRALLEPERAKVAPATSTWHALPKSPLRIVVDGRLSKIDPSSGEWLLLQTVLVRSHGALAAHGGADRRLLQRRFGRNGLPIFDAPELTRATELLPSGLVAEYRRKRAYISSLLSKHEVVSGNARSRRLFVRTTRGKYTLNPTLTFEVGQGLVPLADLLGIPLLDTALALAPPPPPSSGKAAPASEDLRDRPWPHQIGARPVWGARRRW